MATEGSQTAKDVTGERVEHHRGFLEEFIDPDTGLLDILRANGTLSKREIRQIKTCKTFDQRNSELLKCILEKHQCNRLVTALRETAQIHIVNYLKENGEYKPEFGGDWPLTAKEVSILNTNHVSLVDLLDCDELLGLLFSSNIINRRQFLSISSERNPFKKNEALLECLERRSLRDYFQTINCLEQTKQSHIAELLKEGGVIVRVHANLDGENVPDTENELSTAIANMLSDRSIEEANRILEQVNLKVIAAKTGQSIVLYIYCKTIEELQQLHESLTKGLLKDSVELWFNRLLTRLQKITVAAIKISTEESQKMQTYFKEEEIRPQVQKRKYYDSFEVTEQHKKRKVSVTDYIQVHAIVDFDPKQMCFREQNERVTFKHLLGGRKTNEYGQEPIVKGLPTQEDLINAEESDSDVVGYVGEGRPKQYKETQNQEEAIQTEDFGMALLEQEPITDQDDLLKTSGSDNSSTSEDNTDASSVELEQEDRRSTLSDSDESCDSEYVLDIRAMAVSFKRGDKMKTIPPANIGDSVGWWMVRFLDSGKIGFIPRNRIVIDSEGADQPVKTTINKLPLELLDIILQKFFLHYALSGKQSTDKRYEFLVNRLSSVDFCWSQRLRNHRFKKTIWRHLSKFYKEFHRGIAIFWCNRSYLEENIQPKDFISRLRTADCLTDLETRLLNRQTLIQSKKKLFRKNNNPDLLHMIRSFDDEKRSTFIFCLNNANQKHLARVTRNGGALLKAIILNQDRATRQSMVQTINDLTDTTKPRSHQMEKLISQLKNDNIEIINSLLDRHAVVWIWCQSQTGLEKIQKLNESNSLIDVFTGLKSPSSPYEITISLCRDQFKRCIDEFRYKLDPVLIQTIRTKAAEEKNKQIYGLTILDKELFVVSEESSEVEVYDSVKFSFNRRWNLKELINPLDIESCNRNKCLFIADFKGNSGPSSEIFRVDPYGKLLRKWSIGKYCGHELSVTHESTVILTGENKIIEYSPDGKLMREINLSSGAGICDPMQAIKLSNGHFLVSGFPRDDMSRVCVVDIDGKRKSNGGICEPFFKRTYYPIHSAVAENGFVMVADPAQSRVLLFDPDLEFKREILSEEKHKIRYPGKVLLDDSNGRLFVADIKWDYDAYTRRGGRILIFKIL